MNTRAITLISQCILVIVPFHTFMHYSLVLTHRYLRGWAGNSGVLWIFKEEDIPSSHTTLKQRTLKPVKNGYSQ